MPAYSVPAARATAELREKGSRFLAVVEGVADESAARAALAALTRRHADASHLCWAFRLGWPPRERSSDAGEPAGTAGIPMLQVLRGAAVSDVMAVVVRWFGGVKLGKGGLARAYAAVLRDAVAGLPTAQRVTRVRLHLAVPFDRLGAVKRLVRPPTIEIESELYGGESASVAAAGRTARVEGGEDAESGDGAERAEVGEGAEIVLQVAESGLMALQEQLAELRIAVRVGTDVPPQETVRRP